MKKVTEAQIHARIEAELRAEIERLRGRWRDVALEPPERSIANLEVFVWSPPWDEAGIAEPYFDAVGKFVGFCHEAAGAIEARYWMPITYPEPPEL